METLLLENPWIIAVVLVWTLPWKGVALWKSARNGQISWFVILLILNTFAILEIVYLIFFSKKKVSEQEQDQISRNQQGRATGRYI